MDSGQSTQFLRLTSDDDQECMKSPPGPSNTTIGASSAEKQGTTGHSNKEKSYIQPTKPDLKAIYVLPMRPASTHPGVFNMLDMEEDDHEASGSKTIRIDGRTGKAIVTSQGAHHRPIFRRLGPHRPPPSTPPEPLSADQLSMPTLPSLHFASTPALIEQYREERRLSPAKFDQRTAEIKEALIEAKVERGGTSDLLHNEFTAELASRLDAEVIERWSVRRYDEEDISDSGSESEDEYEDTVEPALAASTDDKTVKNATTDTKPVEEDTTDTTDTKNEVEPDTKTEGKKPRVDPDTLNVITIDDIINSLIRLRDEQGEVLAENLLDHLEWTKRKLLGWRAYVKEGNDKK